MCSVCAVAELSPPKSSSPLVHPVVNTTQHRTKHTHPRWLLSFGIPSVEHVLKGVAPAQKPNLGLQRNGRVHLNWGGGGGQFGRLLAAEVCASAVVMVVMLDTPCSEVVCKDYWLPTPLACFPFTSPTVRHRVPSGFNWALNTYILCIWTHGYKMYGDTINEAGNKQKMYCTKYFIHYLGLLNQNAIFLEIKYKRNLKILLKVKSHDTQSLRRRTTKWDDN